MEIRVRGRQIRKICCFADYSTGRHLTEAEIAQNESEGLCLSWDIWTETWEAWCGMSGEFEMPDKSICVYYLLSEKAKWKVD